MMVPKKVSCIYFSPSGTTKQVVQKISNCFGSDCFGSEAKVKEYDLLQDRITEPLNFSSDDLVIIGMPVFAGRIPEVCLKQLSCFKGNNTFAVICVAYGNREYDDALLELYDIAEGQGFAVLAAGAFVTQHSIFKNVGTGRPDESDLIKIENFAESCAKKLKNLDTVGCEKLKVKGNNPYKPYAKIPLKPEVNSKCNRCGACVKICPVKAISSVNPRETDKEKCISCTACISVCTQSARKFPGLFFKLAGFMFGRKNKVRKEPDMYV